MNNFDENFFRVEEGDRIIFRIAGEKNLKTGWVVGFNEEMQSFTLSQTSYAAFVTQNFLISEVEVLSVQQKRVN